ncbi:hypothetical protein N9937_00490 [bacterium]|nr:hypothetical protein [bacterium]
MLTEEMLLKLAEDGDPIKVELCNTSYVVTLLDDRFLVTDEFGVPIKIFDNGAEAIAWIEEVHNAAAKAAEILDETQDTFAAKVQQFASELHEMPIEALSVGIWNGHNFDSNDLQEIVDNTNAMLPHLQSPVKLGHTDDQKIAQNSGLPAVGWIKKLSLVGDRIVATCNGIPEIVKKLCEKAYRRVSCEIIPNWRNPETGQSMRVMSGLALLGADLPAVTNLKDIASLYGEEYTQLAVAYSGNSYDPTEGEVVAFTVEFEENQGEETLPETIKPDAEMVQKLEATQNALKLSETRERVRTEQDAKSRIAEVMKFVTAEETLRILPAQKEAVEKLLNACVQPHVAHFTQGEASEDASVLQLVCEHLRNLPPMTKLFSEQAVSTGSGEQGKDSLTYVEAEAKADELVKAEKMSFAQALQKVCAEFNVEEAQTVKLEGVV